MIVRRIEPVIPRKAHRKVSRQCDFALYAERNLIERFFNALKQFRGIATRYEKTAGNFLAGIHLACALAWLKWGHRLVLQVGVGSAVAASLARQIENAVDCPDRVERAGVAALERHLARPVVVDSVLVA